MSAAAPRKNHSLLQHVCLAPSSSSIPSPSTHIQVYPASLACMNDVIAGSAVTLSMFGTDFSFDLHHDGSKDPMADSVRLLHISNPHIVRSRREGTICTCVSLGHATIVQITSTRYGYSINQHCEESGRSDSKLST